MVTPEGSRTRSEVICFEAGEVAEGPSRHPVARLGLAPGSPGGEPVGDPLGLRSREGTPPGDPAGPVAQLGTVAAAGPGAAAPAGPGPVHVVVVPGNPGCAAYYDDFAAHLCRKLEARGRAGSAVTCVSLAGHSASFVDSPRGLREQVAQLAGVLRGLTGPGAPRTAVVGHSIGAWIVLEALRELEGDGEGGRPGSAVAHVGLLMPFLETTANGTQGFLRRFTRFPAVFGLAFWALSLLPRRAKMWALRGPGGLGEGAAAALTADLIDAGQGYRSAVLARDEFRDLDREYDWAWLRGVGRRATAFLADGDEWATAPVVGRMRERAPGVGVVELPGGVEHGFCTSPGASETVAEAVVGRLEEAPAGDG